MDRREEFVSAVSADGKLAKMLEVPEGAAILRLQVKAYSTDNEIDEYRDFAQGRVDMHPHGDRIDGGITVYIKATISWMSMDAWGPMMWAPRILPLGRSTITLTK